MGRRFKFRMSRVIPSFQSCRSKDLSTLPSNPVPSLLRFSLVNPKPISVRFPTSKPHHSSLRRHVSSAITSLSCGLKSRTSAEFLSETDHTESPPTPVYLWETEDDYHVVAKVLNETPRHKIYNSSASGDTSCDDDFLLPPPPPPNTEKKKRCSRKKKIRSQARIRISTSSADTALFSSDGYDDDDYLDGEETETLMSSRSLTTDSSSEFYPRLETIREVPFNRGTSTRKKKKVRRVKRGILNTTSQVVGKNVVLSSPELESPARLSMFLQRLRPCTVDGKMRESFAVVKKSEDPYEDFKESMMEMILEKQMFEENDLEQLLRCFLSLNSREHHKAIVEAFTEIWDTLFDRRSGSFRVSKAL